MGEGFGSDPANLTVLVNGSQVFSGPVDTLNAPIPALPDFTIHDDTELVSFDVDTASDYTAEITVSISVATSPVILSEILANYSMTVNPAFTEEQLTALNNPAVSFADKVSIRSSVATPAFSTEEMAVINDPSVAYPEKVAIFEAHNASTFIRGNATNYISTPNALSVTIDGVLQNPTIDGLTGQWWYVLNPGSTISYTLTLN